MKTNDNLLKRRFVLAIDEVIPPAPWLENRVIDMVRRNSRPKRRTFGLAGLFAASVSGSNHRWVSLWPSVKDKPQAPL